MKQKSPLPVFNLLYPEHLLENHNDRRRAFYILWKSKMNLCGTGSSYKSLGEITTRRFDKNKMADAVPIKRCYAPFWFYCSPSNIIWRKSGA